MCQMSVLSVLFLTGFCLVASQQSEEPNSVNGCACVPYYQCNSDGTVITDGRGLIDIRANFQDNDPVPSSRCTDYLEICCTPSNTLSPENKIVPTPVQRNGCGRRNPNGVGFGIIGNTNEAQFGEFPWMVAVIKNDSDYVCGGSLIHPQAVLTAAHCVNRLTADTLKVRAGEWDTQRSNEIFPHQDRNVNKIIIHQEAVPLLAVSDYAILILSTPVNLTDNVDVVCLPTQNLQFEGSRCLASGWGKKNFGAPGRYETILKKIELPIVTHESCRNSYGAAYGTNLFNLHSSFICAGGEAGIDTCEGDGGSPLVCPLQNDPTRYAQAGIVAAGIGCGQAGLPGLYANVAGARSWIDEKMRENGLDITVYTY